MNFSERFKLVPGFKSADHTAGIDTDSINMGLVHSACIMIMLGNMSAASPEVLVYSGATEGTKTTALAYRYKLSPQIAGVDGSDILPVFSYATTAGITLTFDTDDEKLLVIEIDSEELTEGEPWLTANINADATIQQAACVIICDPRYDNSVGVI